MNNSFTLRCCAFFTQGFSTGAGFPPTIVDPVTTLTLSTIATSLFATRYPFTEGICYQLSAFAGGLTAQVFRNGLTLGLGYDRTTSNWLCYGAAGAGALVTSKLITAADQQQTTPQ